MGAQSSAAAPGMLQQPSPCICIARLLRWPAQHQQRLVMLLAGCWATEMTDRVKRPAHKASSSLSPHSVVAMSENACVEDVLRCGPHGEAF